MRAILRFLANALAAISALFFVITAVIALNLFNLQQRVFDADTYKQALIAEDFYVRMPTILGEALASSVNEHPCVTNPVACDAENRTQEAQTCIETAIGAQAYEELLGNVRPPNPTEMERFQNCNDQFPSEALDEEPGGGPPPMFENLEGEDWAYILETILPPDELKSLTEEILDGFLAYLNGEADSVRISLATLKRNLAGPAGEQAVIHLLTKQPDCTPEQVDVIRAANELGEGAIDMCNPPEDLIPEIRVLIARELTSFSGRLPDQLEIDQPAGDSPDGMGLSELRPGIDKARLFIRMSLLVPLLFLLGIAILVVRSLAGWLKWWGWPILIAGAICGMIALGITPLTGVLFNGLLADRMPVYLPSILFETGGDLGGALIQEIMRPAAWYGLLMTLTGLAMLLAAAHYEKKSKVDVSAAAAPETEK